MLNIYEKTVQNLKTSYKPIQQPIQNQVKNP